MRQNLLILKFFHILAKMTSSVCPVRDLMFILRILRTVKLYSLHFALKNSAIETQLRNAKMLCQSFENIFFYISLASFRSVEKTPIKSQRNTFLAACFRILLKSENLKIWLPNINFSPFYSGMYILLGKN